ncbi:MAG TPA: hypothetical protein PKY77_12115 [Phycisphaerae bacterium]|nr:hypothetical protein [Phycisphaerae bacterium]HRY69293.1 hypothetical protein [Phycisphaerae bacterium]HSA26611.1 hypothetical protein [Phycisphaerae bacterium]
MKHGTEYAKRIKRLYHDLVSKYGKPAAVESVDPLEQLVIGILAIDSTETKAQAVYRKITQQMVDLNELRVTPALELAEMIGDSVPHATDKARRIVEALNAVRRRQDTLDLSFLKQRGRREAREYLESLDGVPRAAAASVVLFSLGGHAIPVDDLTLYILRKEEMINPAVDGLEAQAFIERHITAAEAAVFALLLSRYVAAHAMRIDVEAIPTLMHPPAPKPAPDQLAPKAEPQPPLKAETAPAKPAGKPEPSKGTPKAEAAKTAAKPAAVAKAAAKPRPSRKPSFKADAASKPPSRPESAVKTSSGSETASKGGGKRDPGAKGRSKVEPPVKSTAGKPKKAVATAKTKR